MRLVPLVHEKLVQVVSPGDTVIDATVGNGYDTIVLAKLVGANGQVFGFDIQSQAHAVAHCNLSIYAHVQLLHAGHEMMSELIPETYHRRVSAVTFNLGYLPGSDKQIITRPETTLVAIESAMKLLANNGLLSILSYRGHAGGNEEYLAINQYLHSLNRRQYCLETHIGYPQDPLTPVLWFIVKNDPTSSQATATTH